MNQIPSTVPPSCIPIAYTATTAAGSSTTRLRTSTSVDAWSYVPAAAETQAASSQPSATAATGGRHELGRRTLRQRGGVPGDRALDALAQRRRRAPAEELGRARGVERAPRLAVRHRRVPDD